MFEDTEPLFKNLDAAVLCLSANKTKSVKKKADQLGMCTKQPDHAVPTDLKRKSDNNKDNMTSCKTPLRKRRNSLNSLLTPRQSNSIAALKAVISNIEADVTETKNANDHHIEEQVFILEDEIT